MAMPYSGVLIFQDTRGIFKTHMSYIEKERNANIEKDQIAQTKRNIKTQDQMTPQKQ